MSARAHPRLVGLFVLGALALGLGAVVLLSSGEWLARTDRFCAFFPGSVRGLNPGSPVTFRGVKIGEVEEVTAFITGPDRVIQIEVVFETRRDAIQASEGEKQPFAGLPSEQLAEELKRRGIRARMLSASLLTGQRFIDLDFQPDEEGRLTGLGRRYPELPTTGTALERMGERVEKFMEKVAELPLEDMLDDVRKVISGLGRLLASDDVQESVASIKRSTRALEVALGDARDALREADGLIKDVGGDVKKTSQAARATAEELRATLTRAQGSLAQLETSLRGTEQAQVDAGRTLHELAQTLTALRNLLEYIETHPEALVIGKAKTEEKK